MQFYFPRFVFFVTAGIRCLQIHVTFITDRSWRCSGAGRSQACRGGWGHLPSDGLSMSRAAAAGSGEFRKRDDWLVCWNKSDSGWPGPSSGLSRGLQWCSCSLLGGFYGQSRTRAHQQGSQDTKFVHWMLWEGQTQETRVGILVLTPRAFCLFTNSPYPKCTLPIH